MAYWKTVIPRRTVLLWLTSFLLLTLLDKSGVFERLQETPYSDYSYPPEIDAKHLLRLLGTGREPAAYRVQNHYERYVFKISNELKCHVPGNRTAVLIVVKSAVAHQSRRDTIRQTWGQEGRFEDVDLRRVFMVGVKANDKTAQRALDAEHALHGDLVQADFIDAYYNNTIKTMLSFRWVLEYCSDVQWIFFVDDDTYVSVKNLAQFVRDSMNPKDRHLVGYVYDDDPPYRAHWSKWYVSLSEYPYSRYPPFAVGCLYLVSMPALLELYQVARYTRQYRFDDVFVGIVARKTGLRPVHSDKFRDKNPAKRPEDFVGLVASHGFHDSVHLVRVWKHQKCLGNA
ncbi:beta-1,3-galactosyltransferase brn-like [Ixodes scapularis]|uniref:beta-1,3-galactosyltransferase brn-like n=1 Tax=Ixodes scapularis TaxID=6945 RepID=UPI001C385756|nr:beta-1,3-galactosyltransferase brn-like [Ixodes scapularis]